MARRLTAVFLLSIFLVAMLATSVLAADKPFVRFKDRASFPARFAPVYGVAGAEQGSFEASKSTAQMTLGPLATAAVGLQISSTSYDYQHNCSMGRQVEHRGTYWLHFDWMDQPLDYSLPGDRGVGVESYDLVNCELVYKNGGKRAGVSYEGYVCMDADPGGCAIPIAHGGVDSDHMSPRAYWDYCAMGPMGLFQPDWPVDKFGWTLSDGVNVGNENLWPIGDMQYGTETVLHMISTESSGIGPSSICYYRRVGAYGQYAGVWSSQRLIDTVISITPVVVASPVSDNVAIAWATPADFYNADTDDWNQYENDVWYVVSTMQGADWIAGITGGTSISYDLDMGMYTGGNITQYSAGSIYKAYCNVSALYTTTDELHIIWGARRWSYDDGDTLLYRRQSGVFHWSTDVPSIATVIKADWDTGGACYGHTWGSDADKISISECDDRLYVLYSQFGSAETPCWDFDSANSVINGELYLTVSGNNGANWDRPQNLTNSNSHDCPIGECDSDNWATMARYGRLDEYGCNEATIGTNVLDIEYINDKSAGGCVQTESGVWTLNPVMWFPTPCRAEVPEAAYSDDAGTGYGECYVDVPLVLPELGSVLKEFTMENIGLMNNHFEITVEYTDGLNWITPVPSSGIIDWTLGSNTIDIDMTISAPLGAPDPSVWVADVIITHDAPNSPRHIPVCLMVASRFVYPEEAFIATACKELRVYNTGELSKDADTAALDFNGDCDTNNPNVNAQIYLYDASPVVSYIDGAGDTLIYTMYSRLFVDDDAFRPIDSFSAIDISGMTGILDAIQTKFYTADSSIGFIAEYYTAEGEENCSFVIEKLKMWNRTDTEIQDVLLGEFLDWDIPSDYNYDTTLSDTASRQGNLSGYDDTRQLIYQYGIDFYDTLECVTPQDQGLRYGGIAPGPNTSFKNSMTLDNPTYVYSTGPYKFEAPLPAGAIHQKMILDTAGAIWSSESADTPYVDISTLVTFGQYDLAASGTDTVCVLKILTTSRTGLTYIQDMVDNAQTLITANALECPLLTCLLLPGDANRDESINVGDAVYMINYVFKGGNAPQCMPEGDANGDCSLNVGDAVYLINYVFKGGNAPVYNPECEY